MKRRLSIVLSCALMISAAASYIVYRLSEGTGLKASAGPTIRLVVAARDLQTGTLVRETDLRIVDWPGSAPKGSATKTTGAVNRGVTSEIYAGEPVTENRLAPVGSGGGLAATIPAGMRACAVKVNDVVGVGGFVTPGMRVDVLITGVPPGQAVGAGSTVKTLLQNIEVLSAGASIEKDKEGKPLQVPVVNLLVTPHQAETLSLAGNETRIQLVLRNPMDTEMTSPPGSFMSELFGEPDVWRVLKTRAPRAVLPLPVPEAPRRADSAVAASFETIEVLNGATHTTAKFPSARVSP